MADPRSLVKQKRSQLKAALIRRSELVATDEWSH
jgi:hypothetical protein